MGERTSHAPGTFSWVDLGTPQPEVTKEFYKGLLGWTWQDFPVSPDSTYSMFFKSDRPVAACYNQPADASGSQQWLSYVTVVSADESAKACEEHGGTMIDAPYDVTDVGRMALLSDPAGAVFALWEPERHAGAGLVNEPGAMCWNELWIDDADKVLSFYQRLFGWEAQSDDMGDGNTYTTLSVGPNRNGGIMPVASTEGSTPHWQVYFAVEDARKAAARTVELGGKVVAEALDMPFGTIAALEDPLGTSFSVFAGELDA